MVDVGQRNVEVARKGYAAFESGDVPAVMDLFADDIVWHIFGKSPLAGDYRGKPAVMEFFGKFLGMIDSQHTEVNDIVANDQQTVGMGTVTLKRKGLTLEPKSTDLIHPDSEGRVKEFWRFSDDQAALDGLLSD